MSTRKNILYAIVLVLLLITPGHGAVRIIIAENGGGEGLIEHTLPALTLAAAQGVDYLEVSVVATADSELVVLNDITLNRLTDVAAVFPGRGRDDGNYYVIDFTLSELRQLRLTNVFDTSPVPLSLAIPSLKEELSLIRRLETLLERQVGLALEIKKPWFHNDEGKDISSLVLDTLQLFDYASPKDKIYLQCYDPEELQRIYSRLLPQKQMHLPLIQRIGHNDGVETRQRIADGWEPYSYDWLFTNIGLRMVASYSYGIALPREAIADEHGTLLLSDYIDSAHSHGLKVLVFSENSSEKPGGSEPDLPALLKFYTKAGIDGLYTDSFYAVQQAIEAGAQTEKRDTDLPQFFSDLELSRPSPGEQTPASGID
jgi:glycerophosphoryl diester phosphodiesterase